MIIATLFAAVIQASPTAAPPTPTPAAPNVMSQQVALDATGVPRLTAEQRRVFVCSRRPPTGSRLALSWCERRAQAEARAQAARESHEAAILNSGWMDPEAALGGPK